MSSRIVEIALVVLALVLAVVALIIGAVSLSMNNSIEISTNGDSLGYSGNGDRRDDKVWLISIGHAGTNYEYVDEATGEVRGFNVDMITAVCRIAKVNCQLVFDSYNRCWNSKEGTRPEGGEGLFAGYYDACTGWLQSYERLRTFKFSDPFTEPFAALITVKPGNPNRFNWRDLTGRTLGFIDGFAYDQYCIARESSRIEGSDLSTDQYINYPTRDALIAAVLSGEVDAAFDAKASSLTTLLEVNSEEITSCAKAGASFMMRKDNGFSDWWNPAFAKLAATSEFRQICDGLTDEHGWLQSYERLRTFKFSDPFTEPFAALITVKPGNPNRFNWRDLTGRTLGFIDGFAYDQYCIARESSRIEGSDLSTDQYINYPTRDALIAAVLSGEVDAAFDAKASSLTTLLEVNSEEITSCAKAGASFMMRKDNGFSDWWNPAFAKLAATSEFRQICDGLTDEHGHKPGPDPVGHCIGIK